MKILPAFIFLFYISFSAFIANCQSSNIFDDLESSKSGQGKIRIIQDKSIEMASEKYHYEMSKQNGIDGYRIRLFSDSGPDAKNKFEDTKARFISVFDNVTVHESFIYPHYKIYVGDFRTRSEALKLLAEIDKYFPNVAFIVPTKINYPKLKTE